MPEEVNSVAVDTRPGQRRAVESLLSSGRMLSYAVTADQTCVLAIFAAEDDANLLEMSALLPIAQHADLNIVELDCVLTPNGLNAAFSHN